MAQDDVELVRRVIEATRSGPASETVEAVIANTLPAIEFVSALAAVEGTSYRGHDGVRRFFEDSDGSWEEWRNEPLQLLEVRPNAVLADAVFRATGKGSGVTVERRNAVLFELSEGKLASVRTYATREEALEALAPTEPGASASG